MAAFALAMLTLFTLIAGAVFSLQAQTDPAGAQAPAVAHNAWSSGAAMVVRNNSVLLTQAIENIGALRL